MENKNISEIFGSMVFNDDVMKAKLPKDIYKSLHYTIKNGTELDITVANVVANAMKDWAIEKGATHYTHWFQPMTGITAEKHDSFISPQKDGHVIMEFSGKELIKGEPDASSFPSGGLRATFEARGYTAWDPTSYAFIKDDSLCIPTVFCSYSGDLLDKKTPLLRSMEVVSAQAIRILNLFGITDVIRVNSTVGPEQEYFLIDRELYKKRSDLLFTGRTLFGAKPPKGQELDDHYFGSIRPRVMAYMEELNVELWKMGVYAKTEHNEAAPAQHELAPVFTTANVATDHNQLTMEFMKRVAERHNLACLLHEKPFAGIAGSGKHNNWSLCTASGLNLFDPGKEPQNNKMFQLFLCAVIKAVDENQDLLRITVSGAGNDHRLGAAEAPPAIVSMFLGDEMDLVLEAIETGKSYEAVTAKKMKTGVNVLPDFQKDTTDRNRTSPFAFTGNKFEFRMLGSSFSIADTNIVLNTIVADILSKFADRLESAENFEKELKALMKETVKKHKRIIFNGNNYSEDWVKEAEKRGLLNLKTTVEALPHFVDEKNIKLFTKMGIFNEKEIRSRYEIMLENYCKVLNIEALTMLEMAKKEILPAACEYSKMLCDSVISKKNVGIDASGSAEMVLCKKTDALTAELYAKIQELEAASIETHNCENLLCRAEYFRDVVLVAMQQLRAVADELETIVAKEYWPFPTYGELLFSV
ncbi:MAG: glutamine synthetase type III [Ruminococcaceae bacterium]|nr:glutamine synthetase type III [Oscillospiraceae bacterium]